MTVEVSRRAIGQDNHREGNKGSMNLGVVGILMGHFGQPIDRYAQSPAAPATFAAGSASAGSRTTNSAPPSRLF